MQEHSGRGEPPLTHGRLYDAVGSVDATTARANGHHLVLASSSVYIVTLLKVGPWAGRYSGDIFICVIHLETAAWLRRQPIRPSQPDNLAATVPVSAAESLPAEETPPGPRGYGTLDNARRDRGSSFRVHSEFIQHQHSRLPLPQFGLQIGDPPYGLLQFVGLPCKARGSLLNPPPRPLLIPLPGFHGTVVLGPVDKPLLQNVALGPEWLI
jgi:hypothetical protein